MIPEEQPPIELSDQVREYLVRMFRAARDEDRNSTKMPVMSSIPPHPIVGKLYYFNIIAGTVFTIEGLYVYKSDGEWYYVPDICTDGAWEDNTADLTAARVSGGGSATYIAVNGGAYDAPRINGSPAVKLLVTFHIKHDVKQGSKIYPHIHFTNTAALTAGQSITFTLSYQSALGHQQAQFPTVTTIVLTYTVPAGGMPAWEHFIVEGTNPVTQAIDMPQIDTLILMSCQVTASTMSGDILGLYVDLHYERERISSKSKSPDFYT